MLPDNNAEVKCPVNFTAMAEMLGLSRIRLYQLIAEGVFPMPAKHRRTDRPYYTPQLQEQCLEIRKTGIGLNGETVIFNTKRKNKIDLPPEFYDELIETLKNMGLKVTRDKVKGALQVMRPKGLQQFVVGSDLVRDLFGYFKNGCKKSV